MGSDVLARVRAEIDARLVELRPFLAEYERLLDAERALAADALAPDTVPAKEPAREPRRRVAARPTGRGPAKAPVSTTTPAPTEAPTVAEAPEPAEALATIKASAPAPTKAPATPKAPTPARTARVRGRRGSAAGAIKRAASGQRDASQQAIVAALEHGSHTLSELVLVTAIAAAELRQGVRGLQRTGTITRTKREGRAAYALSSPSTG